MFYFVLLFFIESIEHSFEDAFCEILFVFFLFISIGSFPWFTFMFKYLEEVIKTLFIKYPRFASYFVGHGNPVAQKGCNTIINQMKTKGAKRETIFHGNLQFH